VAGYLAWRPLMLRWGATKEEAADALPGDDRARHPQVRSTGAITIGAPPERVWPWIVQMGIERAGFYSHDWVERLLGRARYVEGKHSATRIHPELQDLKVGDIVLYGAGVLARVDEIEPFRHLAAAGTWVLRPLPGDRIRLIVRYQGMGSSRRPLARCAGRGAARPAAPLGHCSHSWGRTPRPGGRLVHQRSPASLHGGRDAERDQGARREHAWCSVTQKGRGMAVPEQIIAAGKPHWLRRGCGRG
jgi:hypothetical protein